MELDLTKIKYIAKEKEDENWDFRKFLKGYLDMEVEELDSIVHKLHKKISAEIDCTACGNCCREIQVGVGKKDVEKLSKSLGVTSDQFISKYVEKTEDGDIVIKQVPCPFLRGNKCSHYDSRPEACASYPHLHKKDFVFRLFGVLDNYSVCPIVFNVYEALKDEFESEFAEFLDEYDEFY